LADEYNRLETFGAYLGSQMGEFVRGKRRMRAEIDPVEIA
jgi:hypothetical protein